MKNIHRMSKRAINSGIAWGSRCLSSTIIHRNNLVSTVSLITLHISSACQSPTAFIKVYRYYFFLTENKSLIMLQQNPCCQHFSSLWLGFNPQIQNTIRSPDVSFIIIIIIIGHWSSYFCVLFLFMQ